MPLLNGMRHLDELVGAFGEEHVYGGVCMIHATLDDAGDVMQLTGLHRLGFGPLDGDDDGRLKAVTEALSGAALRLDSRRRRSSRTCGRSGCSWPAWARPPP